MSCSVPRQDFFQGIQELPRVTAPNAAGSGQGQITPERYFTLPASNPAVADPAALIEEVRDLFVDSVRLRLRSDVPVGVFVRGH
jgi:asparagine synthetase B (glutamine-hydrolysing)